MNYMNTNWNNTAFAGNSIPTVGKHIPSSLEAHPYNSAFVSESNTEYNNHYETTPPIISLPKVPTSPSRNPFPITAEGVQVVIEEKVEQKYVPSTQDIEASQNGNSSISTARDASKFTKSDDNFKACEVKKEQNDTSESLETSALPNEDRQNLVAHVIMAARAQALQLERAPLPSISSLPLSFLEPTKKKTERSGKRKKSYACTLCDHATAQRQSLTQHIQSVHEQLRPFQCQWEGCSYNASTKQNVEKHTKAVHEKLKPNVCPYCDASFSQKVTLDNHVRGVHEKVKPFQCPLCSYTSAYRGNFNSHISSVHEKRKPFACPANCGYSCAQKSGLKRHKCA